MTDPDTKARTIIRLRPVRGGRVTGWRARCSACGPVGEVRTNKAAATQEAVDHSRDAHDREALIAVPEAD